MILNKNLTTGIFLILSGALFAFFSSTFNIGTILAIGPGLFPLILSVCIIVIGVLISIKGFINSAKVTYHIKTPLLLITLIIVSGIVSEYAGLMLGMSCLLITSSMFHRKFNIKHAVMSSVIVSLLLVIAKFTIFPTLPI